MEHIVTWQKASKSGNGGNCVEVGITAAGRAAGIRDSKSPERGHLAVKPKVFGAFLAGVKRGKLDPSELPARQSGSGYPAWPLHGDTAS
jgi:hypothetical protein